MLLPVKLTQPLAVSRKVKLHCAEPFTQYWTCIDYTNLLELRRCRKQQAVFDDCVLEKLGWVRPDLGQLSKVPGVNKPIDPLFLSMRLFKNTPFPSHPFGVLVPVLGMLLFAFFFACERP